MKSFLGFLCIAVGFLATFAEPVDLQLCTILIVGGIIITFMKGD